VESRLARQARRVKARSWVPARRERRILRRRRAVDDEARARKRLEHRGQGRVAHPVVRPGHTRAQRKHGIGVEREHAVEAGTELAPGVVTGAGIVGERKAATVSVGLAVTGRVEALRLDRGIGRDAAKVKGTYALTGTYALQAPLMLYRNHLCFTSFYTGLT
jgi:hypothetical protein